MLQQVGVEGVDACIALGSKDDREHLQWVNNRCILTSGFTVEASF
jgi:hypothetical protein